MSFVYFYEMRRISSFFVEVDKKGGEIDLKEVIIFILGAILSWVISKYYYEKSGKELDNYVKELKNENKELKTENEKLKKDVKLQLERQFKLDQNEKATIIKKDNDYGLKTSDSFKSSMHIKNSSENNITRDDKV